MVRGKFITLEGTEGVGKTTQNEKLQNFLSEKGIPFIVTREPGGTAISEKIRDLLLDNNSADMHADAELLLMFAARAQHVQQKILPALQQGQWVICDRFVDSSFAYQGFGRGLDLNRIEELEQWTLQGLQPDKTILFEMDINEGMSRAKKRAELDRFEQEKSDFYQKVQKGFDYRAKQFPDRFVRINAAQSIEQVTKDLIKNIEPLIDE